MHRRVERFQPVAAEIDVGELCGKLRGDRRQIVDRHLMLSRGGAEREEPLLGSFQFARVELAAAQRQLRARGGPLPDCRARRRARRRSLRAGPAPPPTSAPGAGRARRARGSAKRSPPTISCASVRSPAIFSARIRNCRRSASRASSPDFRRELRQAPRRRREDIRRRAREASIAALKLCGLRLRAPSARGSGLPPRRRPARAGRKHRAAGGALRAPTSARSSCWPWISTSSAPIALSSETPQGWSLTKARVLPSAVCTRRRMSAPSAVDAVLREEREHRMIGRRLEDRGDLPALRAGAHQRRVAARAERERQRIEQNGFAGAGLAGQHASARRRTRCRGGRSERYPGR